MGLGGVHLAEFLSVRGALSSVGAAPLSGSCNDDTKRKPLLAQLAWNWSKIARLTKDIRAIYCSGRVQILATGVLGSLNL